MLKVKGATNLKNPSSIGTTIEKNNFKGVLEKDLKMNLKNIKQHCLKERN